MIEWIFVVYILDDQPEPEYIVGPFATQVECVAARDQWWNDFIRWLHEGNYYAYGQGECIERETE